MMSERTSGLEPYTAETAVGIVGLGDMGAPIAKAILRGFPLAVYDLRQDAVDQLVAIGARPAKTLQDMADNCRVAVIVVLTDKQVRQVVDEFLKHPGKLETVIICSTILPGTVIELGTRATTTGFDIIDAPVSGGGEKAEKGIISVLVGGDEGAVKRCWPILAAFGKDLFHLGPVGAGSAGKLMTNLLSLGGNMLLLEAMQFAAAYGITEDAATTFLPTTSADSRGVRTWGRYDRMRRTHTLAGTEEMYEVFAKDMKIAAAAGGERGLVLPIVSAMSAMIKEKAKDRDKYLQKHGMTGPIPRCPVCTLELAYPYRQAGMHPECAHEVDA
jgi:3-hydroxyisobutyrate dehydrogenase-like beta-hydroxyacid dehydrogenase